jgi:hypothetical protein
VLGRTYYVCGRLHEYGIVDASRLKSGSETDGECFSQRYIEVGSVIDVKRKQIIRRPPAVLVAADHDAPRREVVWSIDAF